MKTSIVNRVRLLANLAAVALRDSRAQHSDYRCGYDRGTYNAYRHAARIAAEPLRAKRAYLALKEAA